MDNDDTDTPKKKLEMNDADEDDESNNISTSNAPHRATGSGIKKDRTSSEPNKEKLNSFTGDTKLALSQPLRPGKLR